MQRLRNAEVGLVAVVLQSLHKVVELLNALIQHVSHNGRAAGRRGGCSAFGGGVAASLAGWAASKNYVELALEQVRNAHVARKVVDSPVVAHLLRMRMDVSIVTATK